MSPVYLRVQKLDGLDVWAALQASALHAYPILHSWHVSAGSHLPYLDIDMHCPDIKHGRSIYSVYIVMIINITLPEDGCC